MKQLIILLAAAIGLSAGAQSLTGTWEIFPNYTTPKRLVETPEFVYVLSGTGLCGYDKTTGEVAAYNVGNKLNGNQVENIWYDRDQKCLLVAYTDYNIDLLFDDGRTVNVPDLRDAALTSDKTIRSAAFNNGKAYVGIGSGMLVIDMAHGAITESCIWNKNITRIMATENKILLVVGYSNPIYVADQAGSHHSFDTAFTASTNSVFPGVGWARAGANTVVSQHGTGANSRLYLIKVNPNETNNAAAITYAGAIPNATGIEYFNTVTDNIQPTKNGVLAAGNGKLFYINADGEVTTKTIAATATNRVADWNGTADNLWLANAEGYGQYSPASNAFTIPRTKPRSTSGSNVGNILPLPDGRILIATAGMSQYPTAYNLAFNKSTYADIMDQSGNITSVPTSIIRPGLYTITTNPQKPNEFLTANWDWAAKTNFETNTKLEYTSSNSPMTTSATSGIYVDNDGCLWIFQKREPMTIHKAKAGSWEGETSIQSGWSSFSFEGQIETNHSCRMVVDEVNRCIIITGSFALGIVKMPDKSENLSASLQSAIVPLSTDADGMALSGWHYPAITIDKNNWIWVGSDGGVFVIKNSPDMFNHGFVPTRPKVSRNDGTNLADFLLDNVSVTCIFVDESNQKWIGTMGSGLYRVNADGSAILDHFTTETSEIPSDNILGVYADGKSNKVYVGTDQGLSIYHAKSSPAAPDYDDVYAYPNPVTPDYTGWITISGLMDNSLVKIADASGRVFFEGKSDGGLLVWNGCDASGNRVKSGVYFVFASQHTDGSSAAAVTKIVVIN